MKQEYGYFSDETVAKARAIVRIFETGRPEGRYGALAVLNDGAGISYGVSQFTHRSGSLEEVAARYLAYGGAVGRGVIEANLAQLRRRTAPAIAALARNEAFKKALRAAAVTSEMRDAQEAVADEMYMLPAIRAAAGSGFRLPLSLAVIYDSMVHGSYARIRDRVVIGGSGQAFEKAWVTEYVRRRHAWLGSIARLRSTQYRTKFFLDRIALGQWGLELPVNVHGFWLRDEHLLLLSAPAGEPDTAVGPFNEPAFDTPHEHEDTISCQAPTYYPQAQPPDIFGRIDRVEQNARDIFDRAERIGTEAIKRTDRAKSLWTAVVGTFWQTGWGVLGFLFGVPREVWLVVAIVAAVLTAGYLWRQIELGRMREKLLVRNEK